MPSAEQLPEVIRDLARLQALEISEGRFDREAQELLDAIAGRLSGRARRGPANRNLLLGAIALVTVAMLVAGWWSQRASSPRSELVGRWVAEVDDPEAGPFNLLFDLQTVGDRVLGSVSFPTGVGGIRTGQVVGNRVTFATEHLPDFHERPASIRFAAEFRGQQLHGIMQDDHRARTFVARREQP
jgi:hypothetical protein